MGIGPSASSALKLSKVRPEYFLGFLFFELDRAGSVSDEGNRLRAMARTPASVFSSGCLRGVLAGVGSMALVVREAEVLLADLCCDVGPIPRKSAAWAVLSAVKEPDARRIESMAGARFFMGDAEGVENWLECFLEEALILRAVEDCGEGVRLLLARREERRADLRGE